MKILTILLLIGLAFPSLAFAQEEGRITSGGIDRSFLVYLPAGVAVHGASASAGAGLSTSIGAAHGASAGIGAGLSAETGPASSGGKCPLLLILHGRFGDPKGTLRLADFRPIADREKGYDRFTPASAGPVDSDR